MAVVTLEELIGDITGNKVVRRSTLRQGEPVKAIDNVDGMYAVVPTVQNLSCRGVFDRWVPARAHALDGWAGFKRRFKAAMGVLSGRYDALDWSLTDDQKGEQK